MVFLGFGKWARADRIYALEPLTGGRARRRPPDPRLGRRDRGADHRLADGADDPARDGRPGRGGGAGARDALALAEKIVEDAESGRVDLNDLTRRARRLLESTARPADAERLF